MACGLWLGFQRRPAAVEAAIGRVALQKPSGVISMRQDKVGSPRQTKMRKLLALRPPWAFGIYVVLDTICIGMGMGVPIFCILFGFFVGWYIVKNITATTTRMREVFRRVLLYATITATVTLLGMVAIWGPTISVLFDPGKDLANTGPVRNSIEDLVDLGHRCARPVLSVRFGPFLV